MNNSVFFDACNTNARYAFDGVLALPLIAEETQMSAKEFYEECACSARLQWAVTYPDRNANGGWRNAG